MSATQHNRIGILADQPLVQHRLQAMAAGAGYEIAVNTSPERLNPALLGNETIRVWLVDVVDHDRWDDFLGELLEEASAPILFGDGQIPARTDADFGRWERRMAAKLCELAPVIEAVAEAPEIDFDALSRAGSRRPVYSLPEALKQAPRTELGPLWVLCASLGGPEAVKAFLDVLPGDLPACFLYAQHIDAGCAEALRQSVGRHTQLEVVEAAHGTQLENGRVHLVPVDNEIRFTDNHGIVWRDGPWSGPYGPSHDHLLGNAVLAFGGAVNTIVFSGMGSDATLGATAVQAAGGSVWAQTTESCVQPSMPDSVERSGAASWRGSPEAMAEKLLHWLQTHRAEVA